MVTIKLSLPDSFNKWTNLNYLKLDDNDLSATIPLPSGFDDMGNMKYLALIQADFTELPPGICNMKELEILDLALSSNHRTDICLHLVKIHYFLVF